MKERPSISLDLEMNQPSRSIIEVGATIGFALSGIVIDTQSWIVKVDEVINPFITDLTGITQEMVGAGMPLKQAYEELVQFALKHEAETYGQAITWGGADTDELREQLSLDKENIAWIFGRRYIDVKTIFQEWRKSQSQPIQGGLAKSMLKLGLRFDGRKHRAGDDSKNTFRARSALLRKFRE